MKYDTGSIIKRLGWTLEKLGIPVENLKRLRNYAVKRYYPLDTTQETGMLKNIRWKIYENLGK